MKVPFFRHDLVPRDAERIASVLEGPFLTSGHVGEAVERDLCAFFGARHASLVNSWTNGAVATLLALGIGLGDEVIVPAMTFVATANVVELVGAKPVFVDVDPGTLLMTPDGVRAALNAATRAVIPVHLYGQMVDVVAIRNQALAARSDVAIIEDCAHCFEGRLRGERPGAHSDAAIFSFYATKNVTCGEGGAVITNRGDLHAVLLQTRLHGMSQGALRRFEQDTYRHWDVARLGTKANLPDLLAALLPPQIASVQDRLDAREVRARRYEDALAGTGVRSPAHEPHALHARHLFPVYVPAVHRDRVLLGLHARGVGATVNYRSVPSLTYYSTKYGYQPGDFPISHAWGSGTLSLPLYPSLTEDEQTYVIDTLVHLVRGEHEPVRELAS
ncbi:MAG TPA: DegT/DnrJ/EryC1/StrS family aminotransferase [Polyangiaceae bacterium]|nr:DegT/DnrJ/EryC1/StrS family aminotransferase [Polyangiaceae bacterium]